MSACGVSYLDLLYELCQQNGLALLLTARHDRSEFAAHPWTRLVNLDVVEPASAGTAGTRVGMRRRLTAGDLVLRVELSKVDGDLDAAAELLVGLLQRSERRAA